MNVALLVVLAVGLDAPPPHLTNARLETRSAAAGLAPAVQAVVRAGPGPLWIGYAMPVEGRHQMCCWDSVDDVHGIGGCPGCRLEGHGAFTVAGGTGTVNLEGDDAFTVLLRAEGGRVNRVRSFSRGCALDAGGLPFVWLRDVTPPESLRLLASYVGREDVGSRHSFGESALAAIAFHGVAEAETVLAGFTRADQPERVRKKAAFWLGNARGRGGYAVLARLIKDDPSDDVRAHVAFALGQSEVPEAVDAMIDAARHDVSSHVRGQALFWLAQKAGRKAASAITGAIENDPETHVKEQAVFALSQLPKDEGVPMLIEVARNNRNREVRKKAMFWLGQSNDPRALEFIADVLRR
ncbi:MAG TPA: HEAT repeat domain-containing protein [Vicinamibacteria bacterium]